MFLTLSALFPHFLLPNGVHVYNSAGVHSQASQPPNKSRQSRPRGLLTGKSRIMQSGLFEQITILGMRGKNRRSIKSRRSTLNFVSFSLLFFLVVPRDGHDMNFHRNGIYIPFLFQEHTTISYRGVCLPLYMHKNSYRVNKTSNIIKAFLGGGYIFSGGEKNSARFRLIGLFKKCLLLLYYRINFHPNGLERRVKVQEWITLYLLWKWNRNLWLEAGRRYSLLLSFPFAFSRGSKS